MITRFFLFPVGDERKFFRKRFTRVLIPSVIWCAVYAFYYYAQGRSPFRPPCSTSPESPSTTALKSAIYGLYIWLMAIYLVAPVFSPWIVSASRKSVELFLVLWAITLLLPFIHLFVSEVWGECYWNATPTLYYFSGFIGCRTHRLYQAILDGAFVASRLGRNRHGCCRLPRYPCAWRAAKRRAWLTGIHECNAIPRLGSTYVRYLIHC